MIDGNITSVPVVNQDRKSYFGFLDILDIVSWLVDNVGKGKTK